LAVPKEQTIFAQGDGADAVFYIQEGKVKLTVVSKTGKEATIGILSAGSFFGEGALAGQAVRMGSAAALTYCELLRVDKKAMMAALHREHAFSDLFVAYLLARTTDTIADTELVALEHRLCLDSIENLWLILPITRKMSSASWRAATRC
jgi:CRP/FNR family cyclic AMP-dependent transcriptional regulator